MTIIQFAIARHAAQIADRVLNGDQLSADEQSLAVAVFDRVIEYSNQLSPSQYAAELPHFTAFYEACTVVAKWRIQAGK